MKITSFVLLITILNPTSVTAKNQRSVATVLCGVDKREQPHLVLFGDLSTFHQAAEALPKPAKICLVGGFTNNQALPGYCQKLAPGKTSHYRFGPWPIPKEKTRRLTFAFADERLRLVRPWINLQGLRVVGGCESKTDQYGDYFALRKFND